MFIAIIISLITAIIYGTIAAKYETAENILIPILDIFQSVPILGFLTFTVTWFVSIFPNSSLGIECAVIFATFTNQVPNIAFSFYQSLKTIPNDLVEASNIFKLTPLKKFLKLELPFATQGLIWNSTMSMSGGWFFLVASETVVIGGNTISVSGIGSYIAKAIYERYNFYNLFYNHYVYSNYII
ncbi:MAG TPA: ABC transporter permease subunit [Rickettsia endosymbiont of Columbicola hoogstraali]|nr:ABC transporter permease subunit [Rickettsia endosymbiont of Columbicola hoogstraali]